MSLSRFAQRNIFVPCGGYRQKTQFFALFMTMLVIALWHNVNVVALSFGIYNAVGLIVHRMYAKALGEDRKPLLLEKIFYHILTYLFAIVAFPLVVITDVDQMFAILKALAGLS
jgi:D-alanyl-lipoteichoic acid acyltransferase DltB (MBOAT superfamily)